MNDQNHPFLKPLWRRIALVAFCAAWSVFEFVTGAAFWGTLAGGMAALGAYQFLYAYKPGDDAATDKE
ncbi:DUF3329 domain-containing protein [Aminobacter sp. P9b]|uniref:Benzoate:H+ symporter BenE n=1 Tax=Aminobacter niigataensis TaxID=83265 RepID=A0ABR6L7V5_9HYPH|nr:MULTISPECIES: hypothetical protein [Aminobacter]AWC22789.1 hypothetical protein CO731_02256 [Aminobacter sp. MSH1]MBB4652880.1 putative benzoate:H+ symporter BenE [Aminobacter niigataensis]CAI2933415.1 conserved protein of unknown function [Aminobacter niigataensis]